MRYSEAVSSSVLSTILITICAVMQGNGKNVARKTVAIPRLATLCVLSNRQNYTKLTVERKEGKVERKEGKVERKEGKVETKEGKVESPERSLLLTFPPP